MTDKQMEEIRKRIQDREVGTNGACTHIYIDGKEADSGDIMFLIEKLVEEVEREAIIKEFDKGFVNESDVWKTKEEHEKDEMFKEPTDEERIKLGKLRELEAKKEDEERVRLIKDFLYERICEDQKQGRTGYMDTGMINRIKEELTN